MASQTIQDVKAIYAAAKAKLNSLPVESNHKVQILLMQCVFTGVMILVFVFTMLAVQLYVERERAEEVQREFSQNRRLAEAYFKETQRLQKELDSKKP